MGNENYQALFIIIDDQGRVDEVLEVLLACEIRGATIIETQGMAKALSNRIPLFAGLREIASNEHQRNKTIFAISKHPEKVDKAMEIIAEKFNNFSEASSGGMFVVPVVKMVGLGKKSNAGGDQRA